MWPEVEQASKLNRHELVLTGSQINKRVHEEGLDPAIFQLEGLNYLSITDTALGKLPDAIGHLINLQSLILHTNKLDEVNTNIVKLKKLKMVDFSRNNLQEIPAGFADLTNIVTFNFSQNNMTNFPELISTTRLTVLDLSHNKLTSFPVICKSEFTNLFELKLNGNEIDGIPAEINNLSSLKLLNLNENKIKVLPGELVDCTKLKELNLKENPITDKRLLKLINQCRTKQVLDYVKLHCAKTTQNDTQKKSKKTDQKAERNHSDSIGEEDVKYTIKVIPADSVGLKLTVDKSVKEIREFIVGCVVNNIKFTEETFKKFIQIQNKLHDTVCEKRNLATIATHDYAKLGSDSITYTTKMPQELQIKPLNRTNVMSGAELFAKLQTEANNLRKEKKRSTYSGIHKYLYLIEGKPRYPCLISSQLSEAISFPPITNSEVTKISVDTTSLFIEVTSSVSIGSCRTITDNLLKEMVLLFEKDLEVKQLKIMNADQELRVCYPSKVDFNFDKPSGIGVKWD